MDRGARRATVHGVAKSQTQLYDFHFFHKKYIRESYVLARVKLREMETLK